MSSAEIRPNPFGDGNVIRVLQVIATLDPAGAERQMTHLCRRLDRREFRVAVCCLTRGGPLENDLRQAEVPVHILNKRGRWDLRVLWKLFRVIRKVRPDIVHTWLPTANTLGRTAALLARTPVLIASERAADIWKGSLRRLADRLLAPGTDAIITNADAVKRFLTQRIGLPANKVSIVRNGIDLNEFSKIVETGPSAPLPESDGVFVIGAVGRLEPQKGITYLIEAFAQLKIESPALQLWIVGSGPEAPSLRRQAQAGGEADRIHFLGTRQDVPALMSRFDLFVLPSLWEGLPNVALEAMAARRAVVATAVDGTPEAVIAGETGLLVPPKDPQGLARAMETLIENSDQRKAYGEAGRQRVERVFGMDRMVAETADIYRQLLSKATAHE